MPAASSASRSAVTRVTGFHCGLGRYGSRVPRLASVVTPLGSRPVSPRARRSGSVKAVPRLSMALASTALPRARMRTRYPPGPWTRS